MLACVLNSKRASEISILVARAFVWLRTNAPAHHEIAAKLAELESRVTEHDVTLFGVIETLHSLIDPPETKKKRSDSSKPLQQKTPSTSKAIRIKIRYSVVKDGPSAWAAFIFSCYSLFGVAMITL